MSLIHATPRRCRRFSSIEIISQMHFPTRAQLYIVSSGSSMVVHVVEHVFYVLFCDELLLLFLTFG